MAVWDLKQNKRLLIKNTVICHLYCSILSKWAENKFYRSEPKTNGNTICIEVELWMQKYYYEID